MTTYYISTSGDDTTGSGTFASPWKTIAKFDTVAVAGDILECRGGTYFVTGEQDLDATGTSGSPIAVRPYQSEVPIFDATGGTFTTNEAILNFRSGGDYWTFDGLTLANAHLDAAKCYGINLGAQGCRNVTIQNCTLHHIWQAAIAISGDNHIIDTCTVYQAALRNENGGAVGGNPAGIGTRTNSGSAPNNLTVKNCTVYEVWGEGIAVSYCDTALVENNAVSNCFSKLIYVNHSRHVVIRKNNLFYNNSLFNKNGFPADSVGLASEDVSVDFSPYHVDDIQIYNNVAAGTRRGVNWFQDSSNTSIRNSYRAVKIWHNTFHQISQQGLDLGDVPSGNTQPADCEYRNNIVDGTLTLPDPGAWAFSNNDWWNNGVPSSGSHPNSFSTDPLFTNPNTGGSVAGFKFPISSPCVDSGISVAGVTDDYFGHPRSTDIGFYEFTPSTQTVAGTLSSSGNVTKKTTHGAFSGTVSFAGALVKRPGKLFAAVLNFAATEAHTAYGKFTSGIISFIGSLIALLRFQNPNPSDTFQIAVTTGGSPGSGAGGVTSDYAPFVISVERENHLCQPGHTFTLKMAANAPVSSFQPWDPIQIYENNTLVLTGFVEQKVTRRPEPEYIVRGKDSWKRATDWFIDGPLVSTGETVSYWVDYLCDLCGLSYTIIAKHGSSNAVKSGLSLGLRHVSDSLLAVCAYARWCIRVKPDGVAEFRPTDPPETPDYTLSQVTEEELELSDESTRTTVKVWGMDATGGTLVYSATRTVDRIADRVMVFADPDLDTLDKAEQLGQAALDQFAELEQRTSKRIPGQATVQVGDCVRFYTAGSTGTAFFNTVTDLRSKLDVQIYEQTLTLGRRCFRLPAFPITGGSHGYYCPPGTLALFWSLYDTGSDGCKDVAEAPGDNFVTAEVLFAPAGTSGSARIEKRGFLGGDLIWTKDKSGGGGGGLDRYEDGRIVTDDQYVYLGWAYTDYLQSRSEQ